MLKVDKEAKQKHGRFGSRRGVRRSPWALVWEGEKREFCQPCPAAPNPWSHHTVLAGSVTQAGGASPYHPQNIPSPPPKHPNPDKLFPPSGPQGQASWSGLSGHRLWGNGQAAKQHFLLWKRAMTPELIPCAQGPTLHKAGLMRNGPLNLNSSCQQILSSLPIEAASHTVHSAN